MSTARSVALGVNAEVVLAVSETSGRDDGVQEEMAKTMVCRTWIFASCYRGERQLEFRCSGDATMDAGGLTSAGRPWGWRSY
jgi:hypothetical protein